MKIGQQRSRVHTYRISDVMEDAVVLRIGGMAMTVAAVEGRLMRQVRRRSTARHPAEQHAAGREPLQGNGKQQQPDQGGTETSHAAEFNFQLLPLVRQQPVDPVPSRSFSLGRMRTITYQDGSAVLRPTRS